MAKKSDKETLVEERDVEMVPPSGGIPFFRRAYLLQPSFPCSRKGKNLLYPSPRIHVPANPISPIIKTLASRVRFNGWKPPLRTWNSWVDKMRVKHEPIWKKACIFEAIMASKLKIPKCYGSLFSLAEKWCPETNTFLLPWGEITVTLEDVLVLGGFSVTGDSVTAELQSTKSIEIQEILQNSRLRLNHSKHRKATQKQWTDMWMDKGSEIEHEAFLCLWLSMYVLPGDDYGTINRRVIPLAVNLAIGNKLALAPAVLATIYSDLKLLKEKIETLRGIEGDEDCKDVTKLKLLAPLQFFQAWIWERFPTLSPKPKPITHGFRMERWNKVKFSRYGEWEVDYIGNKFCWRPYTAPLNNWSCPTELYPDWAVWMSVEFGVACDLNSYARCVRTSELVGVKPECYQQYLPHRVAMQFGLDQDIPCAFPHLSSTEKPAWNDYNRPIKELILYVPGKPLRADVTLHYFNWWNKSEVKKEPVTYPTTMDNAELAIIPFQGTLMTSMALTEKVIVKEESDEAAFPLGNSSIGKRPIVNELYDLPSSKRLKGSPSRVSSGIKSGNVAGSSQSSPQVDGMQAEDDSTDDDLTLTPLFRSNVFAGANGGSDTPPSSGDNAALQGVRNNAGGTMAIGCTRIGLTMEDGTRGGAGSPVRSPPNTNKMGEGASSSSGTPQLSGIDVPDRISRLQRVIQMVKAVKNG